MVFPRSRLFGMIVILAACGPTATFSIHPGDDLTNAPADQVITLVFTPGAEERLDRNEIARSIRLRTELDAAVEFTVDFSGFSAADRTVGPVVRAVPDAPLARGWYEAGVALPLLGDATASTRMRDIGGAFGVRFHVGPGPIVSTIRVCQTGSTSFPVSFAFEFSEPVTWTGAVPITITDHDDRPPACNFVADGAAGSLVAHCDTAPFFTFEVEPGRVLSVADPQISADTARMTIDPARLVRADDGCRLWRRP